MSFRAVHRGVIALLASTFTLLATSQTQDDRFPIPLRDSYTTSNWAASLGIQFHLDKPLTVPTFEPLEKTSCPLAFLIAFADHGFQLASCNHTPKNGHLALGLLSIRQTATERSTRLEFRIDRNFF